MSATNGPQACRQSRQCIWTIRVREFFFSWSKNIIL